MRLFKLFTLLVILMTAFQQATAQRYMTPQFSQVAVATVPYGTNFTFLPIIAGGRPARQPLVARVYTPVGDSETKRPLIIYLKTGNFFPFPANGSCGGALNDSSNIEFATRLAKLGYVVAVADYRGGWFPTAADPVTGELVRRYTLINAAYRGVQDVRTCIRFFRRNVAEAGNQFGIDPTKVVVWGQGTGGYISLAAAYLNTYNEILTTSDPNKFKIQGQIPMVTEAFNGDIYATSGPCIITDPTNPLANPLGIYKQGDTLCVPNHVGYSSAFTMAVNMGGSLGDSTWLDDGEMPLVSYHVPTDGFAPCKTNVLNVPTINGPLPVVEVSGSCDLQQYVEKYGNNDVFKKILPGANTYDAIAKARNGGASGFFPFIGTPKGTSSPWEWTSYSGDPPPAAGTDCNVDAKVARTYIDTIIAYYIPRGCVALGLGCAGVSSTNELLSENEVQIVPNPAQSVMQFNSGADHPIQSIELFDISGRMVHCVYSINQSNFEMQRGNIVAGMYVAKVRFRDGIVARRVVFE